MYPRTTLLLVLICLSLSFGDPIAEFKAAITCLQDQNGQCKELYTEGYSQCLQCINPPSCVGYVPCSNHTYRDRELTTCHEFSAASPQIYTPDDLGCVVDYYWTLGWAYAGAVTLYVVIVTYCIKTILDLKRFKPDKNSWVNIQSLKSIFLIISLPSALAGYYRSYPIETYMLPFTSTGNFITRLGKFLSIKGSIIKAYRPFDHVEITHIKKIIMYASSSLISCICLLLFLTDNQYSAVIIQLILTTISAVLGVLGPIIENRESIKSNDKNDPESSDDNGQSIYGALGRHQRNDINPEKGDDPGRRNHDRSERGDNNFPERDDGSRPVRCDDDDPKRGTLGRRQLWPPSIYLGFVVIIDGIIIWQWDATKSNRTYVYLIQATNLYNQFFN